MERRVGHLKWCKQRANKHVDSGDILKAYEGFIKDMREHPDTANHIAIQMGGVFAFPVHSTTSQQMKNWINGFN